MSEKVVMFITVPKLKLTHPHSLHIMYSTINVQQSSVPANLKLTHPHSVHIMYSTMTMSYIRRTPLPPKSSHSSDT